jgi:hypothetical protein
LEFNRRHLLAGMAGLAVRSPVIARETSRKPMSEDSIFELRQYTLRGGQRDTLISIFESNFIEPQNALGAHVRGSFCDLDDPDRFVWIRGFADMQARQTALQAFYTGPVWQANRAAANATMLDSDNVLLLRPLPNSGALLTPRRATPTGIVRVSIHSLAGVSSQAFTEFFENAMRPLITDAGGEVFATLLSETQQNDFTRLPVREHESLFVWITRMADAGAEAKFTQLLARRSGWRDQATELLWPAFMRKPEVLRLNPTSRSCLG